MDNDGWLRPRWPLSTPFPPGTGVKFIGVPGEVGPDDEDQEGRIFLLKKIKVGMLSMFVKF